MRKAALYLLLMAVLLALTGCATLEELSHSDALPDLRLLEQPAYKEPVPTAAAEPEAQSAIRLDLWLDASQVMGGINPNEKSMYPHASRKYREGGFHYRYENQPSMYETMLRCLLSGMEDSRVRLLRFGNERLTDEFLMDHVAAEASQEQLCSIRRDMLTYAIDPMPDLLEGFSGEKMTDSFYSLGTPQLNQMANLNARFLENPELSKVMAQALDQQIHAIAKGYDDSLNASADDTDYPLLYALENLDLNRLSVITFDPAAIRKLNAVDQSGDSHALVQEILSQHGVFDSGMAVGLYAFTLDYMGQMGSFGSADFSEPLLWGRLDFNNYTGKTDGILVMPRTLLMLVIGKSTEVDTFTAVFEKELAACETLKVPRGPQNGQLTYTRAGQTVVQEPFGFAYDYTLFSRPSLEVITQQTEGASVSAEGASITQTGSLHTVSFVPGITLTLPLNVSANGMTVQADQLTNLQLTVETALLESKVLPNSPDTVIPEGAQSIALRDKIHVFTTQQAQSPLQIRSVSAENGVLTIRLAAEGDEPEPGYYRMHLSADLPGESFVWNTPEWIKKRSTTITNGHISEWEAFTEVLTRYERKREYISRPFQHAWGDAENTSYYGEAVPEFPPVTLAPGLSVLVSQLQAAAHPQTMPYISFVFDLFVDNQP